jgi:GAF domain-containing protein
LRSLASLTNGLERFGRGDFNSPIPVMGHDELQKVAAEANQMADSLRTFSRERDDADWLKGALVGLAEEIRGELAPAEVASRTLRFLSRYLDMPAGALYALNRAGVLELLATHAGAGSGMPGEAAPSFRLGEGLVGQAALSDEPTIVTDPPAGYLRISSGLGGSAPRAIVLLPLLHVGQIKGVLEFASFVTLPTRTMEAMLSIREMLGIALEVARARDDMRDLLAKSQEQRRQLEESSRGRSQTRASSSAW